MRVGKVSALPASPPVSHKAAPVAPSEPNPASMIVTQTPPLGQKIAAGHGDKFRSTLAAPLDSLFCLPNDRGEKTIAWVDSGNRAQVWSARSESMSADAQLAGVLQLLQFSPAIGNRPNRTRH